MPAANGVKPIVSTTRMNSRQFLELGEDPPGVRLELVDGEVAVSPSPTPKHSHVVINLITILNNHITEHDLGELHHDVDTILDLFNVRRPDIGRRRAGRGDQGLGGQPDQCFYTTTPGPAAMYRPQNGEVTTPDGAKFTVSDSTNIGDDGWKHMLAPAG